MTDKRTGDVGRRGDDGSPNELDASHPNDFPFLTPEGPVDDERRLSIDRRMPTRGIQVEHLTPSDEDPGIGRGD